MNEWEKYPKLEHLEGKEREAMESRRRHRGVRYWLFRLQHGEEHGAPEDGPEELPGFVEFWLTQRPEYVIGPNGEKLSVPQEKRVPVALLGGYGMFATLWDVDADLVVYLRHSSVWQEWNATLYRIVPVLGER